MDLTLEQHIIHQLLLRSSMGKDVGIYHGKMGVVLFFAHYFRHTGLQVYKDTADELLDELIDEIHTELPFGFAFGLSGIGWGIEYLIQKGFDDNDSLDICEEIDKKLMEKDPRRMIDYSLDHGLEGMLHYVLAHIKGVMSQHAKPPFDEEYLDELYQAVNKASKDTKRSENFKSLSSVYAAFFENRKDVDYALPLSLILGDVKTVRDDLNDFPLGLKDGMAGYLLKQIMTEKV